MSVTLSKPPKPLKVTRRGTTSWRRRRTPEERRAIRRKIEAIRRAAEHERLKATGLRIDIAVLRSPKMVVGLLAVLLIIGGILLSAFHRPRPTTVATTPLSQMRARRSLVAVAKAMTLYRVHTGGWPQQRLGLYALAKDYAIPGWKGPYINWAYKDPWGTPYVYKMPLSPFEAPELFSCGPDEKPETNDDIRTVPEDFVCDEGTWRRETGTNPETEQPSEHVEHP